MRSQHGVYSPARICGSVPGMSVWSPRGRLVCGRNFVLVILLFAVLLFSAWSEGYLQRFSLPFGLLLGGGLLLSVWMAMRASTARFVVLLLTIFLVEYVKETLGIRAGLWAYTGPGGQYLFGVLAWVLGGTSAFVVAFGVIIPLLLKIRRELPRWLNQAFLLLLFVLIPLTVDPYPSGAEVPYWSFYGALFVLGLVAAPLLIPGAGLGGGRWSGVLRQGNGAGEQHCSGQ